MVPVLPACWNAVELRAPRGAFFHHVAHHAGHVGGDQAGIACGRLLAVAIETPDQIASAGSHFQHGMRLHAPCPCWGRSRSATACSSTLTSSEPIGSDGVSGSGAVMPNFRAVSMILARPAFGPSLPPSAIESFTGTTLIERVMACVRVTAPE